MILMVGGLEDLDDFSIYWKFHNPNWRTHIFQTGRYTTNIPPTSWPCWDRLGQGPNGLIRKLARSIPRSRINFFRVLCNCYWWFRIYSGQWLAWRTGWTCKIHWFCFFLVLYVCTDQKVGKHVDTITRNWVKLKLCRNRPLNSLGNKPRLLQIFPSSYPSTSISQDEIPTLNFHFCWVCPSIRDTKYCWMFIMEVLF